MNNEAEDKHECFVFISDKLAEEITLTIGQAFELAYKRFLESSGKDLESQRRAMVTQQKIKRLEQENNVYKQRLLDLTQFGNIKPELDQYLRRNAIKNILEIQMPNPQPNNNHSDFDSCLTEAHTNGGSMTTNLVDFSSNGDSMNGNAPPIPPRTFDNAPVVGTKLEGLLLNELEQDNDFDPRSFENNLASHTNNNNTNGNHLHHHPPLSGWFSYKVFGLIR